MVDKVKIYRMHETEYDDDYNVIASHDRDYWPKEYATHNLVSIKEILSKFFIEEDLEYLHEIDPDFVEKIVRELEDEINSHVVVTVEEIKEVTDESEIPSNYCFKGYSYKSGGYISPDRATLILNKYKKMLNNHSFEKKKLSEEEEEQILRKLFGR